MNDNKIILISLVLFDCGGIGHNYEYVDAVYNATEKIEWKHYAALPSNFSVINLKKTWTACLRSCRSLNDTKENLLIKIFRLILNSLKLSKSIYQYLDNILSTIDKEALPIIFIDSFKPPEILSFIFALCFLFHKNLTIWLLYRHDDYKKFGYIYKIVNLIIEKKVSKNNLNLLTDSEKLRRSLISFFDREVYLLPIPHTEEILAHQHCHYSNYQHTDISCVSIWWPGNPNLEKGLETIKNIVQRNEYYVEKINLFLSETTILENVNKSLKISYLPSYLNRKDYLRQLLNIDIVILPYDSLIYSERTSGIFVETICAKKIPLVSYGTWMADELERFNLQDLIINWQRRDLFEFIFLIFSNVEIKAKIKAMCDFYLEFHSINSYANCMQQILKSSNV